MLGLFGLDVNSQATGEIDQLNDRRDGLKSWDLGDMVRSAITGVSKEDIIEAAGKQAADRIQRNNSGLIGDVQTITEGSGLTTGGLTIKPGET